MSKKKGGVPAFPRPRGQAGGKYNTGHEGMSLRDWFAGMALSNFGIRRYQCENNYRLIAETCYKLADAMLKEREKDE